MRAGRHPYWVLDCFSRQMSAGKGAHTSAPEIMAAKQSAHSSRRASRYAIGSLSTPAKLSDASPAALTKAAPCTACIRAGRG